MRLFLFLLPALLMAHEIDLSRYERSLYSQSGEDGVLAQLFHEIKPASKFCVDLGAGDGETASSTHLLCLQGWKGVRLDRQWERPEHQLHKEFVTAENVNALLERYPVPTDLDLLVIDLGYNDFYIWQHLDPKYRPAVVVIGYNGALGPHEALVVKYRPYYVGDETDYFGASILALAQLGQAKGYNLVYAERSGTHLFFVRDDVPLVFTHMNEVDTLYRPPASRRTTDFRGRAYVTLHGGP